MAGPWAGRGNGLQPPTGQEAEVEAITQPSSQDESAWAAAAAAAEAGPNAVQPNSFRFYSVRSWGRREAAQVACLDAAEESARAAGCLGFPGAPSPAGGRSREDRPDFVDEDSQQLWLMGE